MLYPLLALGVYLFPAMVFFAVRKKLAEGDAAGVLVFLARLRERMRPVLFIAAFLLLPLGAVFGVLQAQAISEQAGVVGPLFMIGVACAIPGAAALAAALHNPEKAG